MSKHTQADPRVAGMNYEDRAMVALGSVIFIVSQTKAEAEKQLKRGNESKKLLSRSVLATCSMLIQAINQAGIDYDDSVAKMKAWQKETAKTLCKVMRGTFAAPSGKAVAV